MLKPLIYLPLVLAVVVSAGIHLLAVVVPSLQPVFRTMNMAPDEWLLLLALAASIIPVVEIVKFIRRAVSGGGGAPGPASSTGSNVAKTAR